MGPGPRLMKKRIYRAAVSQRLRNTALEGCEFNCECPIGCMSIYACEF